MAINPTWYEIYFGGLDMRVGSNDLKQAENGLQSRSSENGSMALWIKIAVILTWR